jgi:hypothetical protein
MHVAPITPANIDRVGPGDPAGFEVFLESDRPRIIEEFFRKQIRAICRCAILAWDQGGVIGTMYFTTRELFASEGPKAAGLGLGHDVFAGCMCIQNPDMPEAIRSYSDDQLRSLLGSPSSTLRVLCVNVGHFDTRYHGQGIASAMLQCLNAWALERGWHRIRIASCADVVPFRAVGPHVLRRSCLEQRGFEVTEDKPAPCEEVARRGGAVEEILSGNLEEAD